MKERGIIFNDEMVRAILNGRKTQTRRIIKKCTIGRDAISPFIKIGKFSGHYPEDLPEVIEKCCPFGVVGDQLWVRETFSCIGNEDGHPVDANDNLCNRENAQRIYRASAIPKPNNYGLWTSPDGFDFDGTWTPSIHMPRWASRITLEITGVRVEKLQDVSEQDAAAEGVATELSLIGDKHYLGYRSLCKSIYGDDSWQANPWVWVIEFKRVEVQ